jgi:hypothetical protein
MMIFSIIEFLAAGHCYWDLPARPDPISPRPAGQAPRPAQASPRFLAKSDQPSVAPFWSANFSFDIPNPASLGWHVSNGFFVYDGVKQKARMDRYGGYSEKFGEGATFQSTNYAWSQKADGGKFWEIQNGQCFSNRNEFYLLDFFAWLAYANQNGTDTVTYDGKSYTCDKWTFHYPGLGDCIACMYGDIPVYLSLSELEPFKHNGKMNFYNFQRQDQSVFDKYHSFQLPQSCDSTTQQTCGTGEIKKIRVYWSHPKDNYDISGQDVADMKGDAAFLCVDEEQWTIGDYSLLTEYEISVLDKFSQYTNYPAGCPPNSKSPCVHFGGDGFHVGRASVLNVGKRGGQCDDDAEWWNKVGIWYSMPPGGQCKTGQTLGVDCTWRLESRLKTIDFECLFNQQHMVEMCKTTKAPFDDVTELLKKALSSEENSKGGCPAVGEPMI